MDNNCDVCVESKMSSEEMLINTLTRWNTATYIRGLIDGIYIGLVLAAIVICIIICFEIYKIDKTLLEKMEKTRDNIANKQLIDGSQLKAPSRCNNER